MWKVRKDFFIFVFILFITLNTVCSTKWAFFYKGCDTLYGRIDLLTNRHLSHCTAECNANDKCKVYGYSSSDKVCYLYDETFTITTSCSAKTVMFYEVYTGPVSSISIAAISPTQISSAISATTNSATTTSATTNSATTYSPATNYATCTNLTGYMYETSLNKCIRFYNSSRLTWEDAKNVCENEGTHLVYIKTQEVLDYIRTFQESNNTKYWIGGKQSQVGSKQFEWLSGEQIDETNGGTLWLEGRPQVADPTYNYCIEVKTPKDKDVTAFGLFDRECNTVRKFFCELDLI